MRMNTSDVQRKLGCGEPTIKALIAENFLSVTETPKVTAGGRHYTIRSFDPKEISAIAKVYKKKGRMRFQIATLKNAVKQMNIAKRPKTQHADFNGNGSELRLEPEKPVEKPIAGINSRLDRIETMLAKLLEMWS